MFQMNISHVLRICKVKRGMGFIVTVTSGEERHDDEQLELKLVYRFSSTKISS